MSLSRDIEQQAELADTFRQMESRMTVRDRCSEALAGLIFVVAAAALLITAPVHHLDLPRCLVDFALVVFAATVRFETPFGFTVATQLAFVPLLFELPIGLVPPAMVGAFVLAGLPMVIRGRHHPSRLLLSVGNSCFALGPCAVFAIAGVRPEHAGVPLLLVALGAQFLVDFAVSSLRLAIARDASFAVHVRDCWVYGVDLALSGVGLAIAQDMRAHPGIELTIAPMLALLAAFARERHDRLKSLLELGNAYRGTALVLGDVVEADDAYTGAHSRSVVALSLEVGERLGLDAARQRNLEFGALLHDVGKVAIPKEIINKPGKLDPHEWTIIKTHTTEGQKMLDRVGGFMREVGLIVRSHHERWDGGGYPDGLRGEDIPLEARIISCCDSWSAMRTDRAYRKALPVDVALAELQGNAGTQFDPDVAAALIAIVMPHAELVRRAGDRRSTQLVTAAAARA